LAPFGARFIASNQTMLLVEQITGSVKTMTKMIIDETEGMKLSLLLMRLENANALWLIALTRMAQGSDSFTGKKAELVIENLLDQLEAMTIAPVSQKSLTLLNNS
jgi:hypothetical protein